MDYSRISRKGSDYSKRIRKEIGRVMAVIRLMRITINVNTKWSKRASGYMAMNISYSAPLINTFVYSHVYEDWSYV